MGVAPSFSPPRMLLLGFVFPITHFHSVIDQPTSKQKIHFHIPIINHLLLDSSGKSTETPIVMKFLILFVGLVAASPVAELVSAPLKPPPPSIPFLVSHSLSTYLHVRIFHGPLTTLTAPQIERQFGGGGGKSLICQHDHLHMNPDCKAGGSGSGKGGGLAGKGLGKGGKMGGLDA